MFERDAHRSRRDFPPRFACHRTALTSHLLPELDTFLREKAEGLGIEGALLERLEFTYDEAGLGIPNPSFTAL